MTIGAAARFTAAPETWMLAAAKCGLAGAGGGRAKLSPPYLLPPFSEVSCSLSAIRARSGNDAARIFLIT